MRVVFVGRDRRVWRRLALYMVTLGVSRRVWLTRVNKELDGHEVLGLDHRAVRLALAAPLGGLAVAGILVAAGLGWGWAGGAVAVSLLPGTIVVWQTARRMAGMLHGSGIPFGPPWAIYLPTLVPLVGHIWYISWLQSRLNRFWAYERKHPEHGIEIDVGLESDPGFRAEIGRALKESYDAGSRFERRKRRRRAWLVARRRRWDAVRQERVEARRLGAATPLLPWLRPHRPPRRILHITCGRCEHRFDLAHDPLEATPVVCPSCGLTDVIPSVRADPGGEDEPAAVPEVRVDCPACGKRFHAVRNLHGPTTLACPHCGKTDVLPDPGSQTRSREKGKAQGTTAPSGAAAKRAQAKKRARPQGKATKGKATKGKATSTKRRAGS